MKVSRHVTVGDHKLHITNVDAYHTEGTFDVWLNTEVGDFDGVVIGAGETEEAALRDAMNSVLQVAFALTTLAGG